MGDEESEVPAQAEESHTAEQNAPHEATETHSEEPPSEPAAEKSKSELQKGASQGKVEEKQAPGHEAEGPKAVRSKHSEHKDVEKQKSQQSHTEESKPHHPDTEAKVDVEKSKKPSQEVIKRESVKDVDTVKEDKTLPTGKTGQVAHDESPSALSIGKKISGAPLDATESLERKPRGSARDDGKPKSRSERLNSRALNVLGSRISIRRLSTIGEFYDRSKGARFMNTYKLDADNPFHPEKVKKILEVVMVEALENLTYDLEKCPKQAKWASSAIRAKVKELQFDRYKLICLVTIGEKNSQDVFVTCRFLWDVDRDRYATYCMENTYVFGIAQCFGVYYE